MVKYLIASHGRFSEGTVSFLKIMTGEKENVYTLSAFLDDRSIQDMVKDKLKEIGEFDQLIVFCDIYGGSVAQEVFKQTASDDRNIQIIAGYNLALVMDLILKDSVLSKDDIRESIEGAKNAMVYLNDIKQTHDDELF